MIPPPVLNFKRQEPAGMGEFTCGFFAGFLQVPLVYLDLCDPLMLYSHLASNENIREIFVLVGTKSNWRLVIGLAAFGSKLAHSL